MRSMGLFNLAALVASVMVLAIAAVLVPDKSWSNAAITAVVIFALAVGFVFYVPSMLVKSQSDSDAAQMASLGPLGVVICLGATVLRFRQRIEHIAHLVKPASLVHGLRKCVKLTSTNCS